MSLSPLHHSPAMAAVMSSKSCLPNFSAATLSPRKPLRVLCAISTSTPRKFTRRKNCLRQKLLKTLTKPVSSSPTLESTPSNPLTPIELQSQEGLDVVENEQFQEVEFQAPKWGSEALDGFLGNLPKVSIFQYGLWFFGAFLFHTIVAVWKLGSLELENKKRNDEKIERKNRVLEVGLDGKGRQPVKLLRYNKMGSENEGVVYLDEDEMEKQIEEIRVMAREARAREKLEGKNDGYESDEEAEIESSKSGIEKEVSDRLVKLRKRLENNHRNSPQASVDDVKKDVNGKNNLDRTESIEALMFKKKHRFRGLSSRPSDKPKGFTGRIDDAISKDAKHSQAGGSAALINGDIQSYSVVDSFNNVLDVEVKDDDPGAAISLHLEEDGSRKQALEATKSSRTAVNKLTDVPNKHDEMKETGNLENIEIEQKQSGSKIEHKKSESETEPWWSSLRYVLVILMQGEHDGPVSGLFTLRNSSALSGLSHTVAFEDRGDATNFCYLVQSFFEDLEGFGAQVVPLPIKELSERVKSQTMKVIVVKKGQLKLFAGQPLQDAEMALRSLVDQS